MDKRQIMELIDKMFELGYTCPYETTKLFVREYEKLNEPQKAKIPQFVAKIIEYYKKQNATLYDALREKNFNKQYADWLLNEQGAYDKVARAWLDGYEVEEEKRYWVKVKGTGQCLEKTGSAIRFSTLFKSAFTKKELEEVGFGWVFDCEGVEIEEVDD